MCVITANIWLTVSMNKTSCAGVARTQMITMITHNLTAVLKILTDLNLQLDGEFVGLCNISFHVLFFKTVGKQTFFFLHVKIEIKFFHARIGAKKRMVNAQSNVICHKTTIKLELKSVLIVQLWALQCGTCSQSSI